MSRWITLPLCRTDRASIICLINRLDSSSLNLVWACRALLLVQTPKCSIFASHHGRNRTSWGCSYGEGGSESRSPFWSGSSLCSWLSASWTALWLLQRTSTPFRVLSTHGRIYISNYEPSLTERSTNLEPVDGPVFWVEDEIGLGEFGDRHGVDRHRSVAHCVVFANRQLLIVFPLMIVVVLHNLN